MALLEATLWNLAFLDMCKGVGLIRYAVALVLTS